MSLLFLDFETRSTCDLARISAWKYARCPGTGIWGGCFAVGEGEVKVWKPGDPVPVEIATAAEHSDYVIAAHNASFERAIWVNILTPRYGWPAIGLDRFRCTMAMAQAMALPGKLEKVAKALELPHQKDAAGTRLMKLMSKPRKLRKGETGIHWHTDPAKIARLIEYCKADVEVERSLHQRLPPLSPDEQSIWYLNERINEFGIPLDRALLAGAIKAAERTEKKIKAEFRAIAGLSPYQTEKVRTWLKDAGVDVANLREETLKKALAGELPLTVRRAIELRLAHAQAGAKKLISLAGNCDDDDRCRGSFRYHGAHTGRFTSHGVQTQNMKKSESKDLGAVIAAVHAGAVLPLSALGDLPRAIIAARAGHLFFAADYSGIESVTIAWLAGETSKLDMWRKFFATKEDDPYFLIGKMLGVPDEDARAIGKVADLAFGYAGGIGAWRKFAPNDPRTDAEIKELQAKWKAAHPRIVKFWHDLERAAINAVKHRGAFFAAGRHLSFRMAKDDIFLKLSLPAGRALSCPFARIGRNDRNDEVVIYKVPKGPLMVDCRGGVGTYGGHLAENATQAVARDVLTHGMVALDAAGFPLCLHIHDEVVAEVENGFSSVDEFVSIMTTVPIWAEGLPLSAKGRNGARFAKIEQPENPPQGPGGNSGGATPDEKVIEDAGPGEPSDDQLESEAPTADTTTNGGTHWQSFDFSQYDKDEPESERDNSQILARYIYEDAGGRPYHRVNRRKTNNPKRRFFHEHWNGSTWIPEKPPGGPIPFRLPELIKATPDEIVVITEGEKDALTAIGLGFVATCNPGGAGKFDENLARWLTGKMQVVICEDHDQAGEAHAAKTADMLQGIVADIRIARFPELPAKGDLSDWVDLGGTRDEFLARATVAPAGNLESVRASNITIREISWIWPGRFAIGKLGLIVGLPDVGKGQALCDIAARITRGLAWPCKEGIAPIGNVILLTAEDDPEDTVVPRLIAAGADLTRIEIVRMIRVGGKRRMFSLVSDLEFLRRKIIEVGDVRIVQIDPISAYLGVKQVDSFRTPDVRAVLGPVVELSTELAVSMLGIMHFNKKTDVTNALLRISDSLAFGATARHVYAVIDDAENKRKLLVRGKNNLTTYEQKALSYTFGARPVGKDPKSGNPIIAPHIIWGSEHVDVTATEAMQAAVDSGSPSRRDKAKEFLLDMLAGGPVPSDEIKDAARENGISKNTLYRAQGELKIKAVKDGPKNDKGEITWQWYPPEAS
jgi:DNA polymerase